MPAQSASYGHSCDSQLSTPGGRCNSRSSSGEARHYIDPWDLENDAYLRRRSVALATSEQYAFHQFPRQLQSQHRRAGSYARITKSYHLQPRQAQIDYRCIPSPREPCDNAFPLVEGLQDCYDNVGDHRTAAANGVNGREESNDVCLYQLNCRHRCHAHRHHPSIYHDQTVEYNSEPLAVCYLPFPDSRYDRAIEKSRINKKGFAGAQGQYPMKCDSRCAIGYDTATSMLCREEYRRSKTSNDLQILCSSNTIDPEDDTTNVYVMEMNTSLLNQPRNTDLNTYGHLKIDYANSWNYLNWKINK